MVHIFICIHIHQSFCNLFVLTFINSAIIINFFMFYLTIRKRNMVSTFRSILCYLLDFSRWNRLIKLSCMKIIQLLVATAVWHRFLRLWDQGILDNCFIIEEEFLVVLICEPSGFCSRTVNFRDKHYALRLII